ncbi:hypothetical protein [uncultured Dokdonia sp.]|uniref:hypothetical protein n=1 Tax=uncultured Dokdonia sp. TaxID=575653 RepID=UPI00261C1EDD|nr:hypothetical protein [uncultured Dokdonia sp.]
MKTILKTIACSLLIAGTVNAQSITDKANITTIKEYELNNEEIVTIKTISKERRDLSFKVEDAGKLNQSLVDAPVYVEKIIMIDHDNDTSYDKEVLITYQKDVEDSLNYTATPEGVYITSSDSTPLFVTEEGTYQVDSQDVEDITIVVEDLNKTK